MRSSIFHGSRFLKRQRLHIVAHRMLPLSAAVALQWFLLPRTVAGSIGHDDAAPAPVRIQKWCSTTQESVRNWWGIGEEWERAIREQTGRTLPTVTCPHSTYLHTSWHILVDGTDPSLHPQSLKSRFQDREAFPMFIVTCSTPLRRLKHV